jgi:S1-C subfamily serine protease
VSRNPAAAQEMVRRSGQQGVPVITAGDQVIVGFDRPRLEQIAARLGGSAAADGRPHFGAGVADAAGALARRGKPAMAGAYVGTVKPGSPAERAGVRPGDVLIELGGRPISTAADFERLLKAMSPGASVPLIAVRDGERVRLQPKL